jgi:hypothetical protein
VYAAAAHLTAVGAAVTPPRVEVSDTVCGDAAVACANTERIVLTEATAGDARVYARMITKTTRAARQRAYATCVETCLDVQDTALHELVHVARMQHGLFTYTTDAGVAFEEGLASAVAHDQACAMEYRVTGAVYRFGGWAPCSNTNSGYDDYRGAVDAMGGRWWRLERVTHA